MYETRLEGKQGGYVDIHAKTDRNKKQEHIEASQVLADKGHQVILMPEIDCKDILERNIFFPEFTSNNKSNPDLRLNGILGDFKIPDSNPVSQKNIKDAITSTAQKNVSICVISLLGKSYVKKEIFGGIRGALKQEKYNSEIKEVWLIFADLSLIKIPRGIASNNNFYKLAFSL